MTLRHSDNPNPIATRHGPTLLAGAREVVTSHITGDAHLAIRKLEGILADIDADVARTYPKPPFSRTQVMP